MARFDFGGVMAAWVVTTAASDDEFGTGTHALMLPNEDVTLAIFDAPDGAAVTDFIVGGSAAAAVTIPANTGTIPKFSGPDGVTALWVENFDGAWVPIPRFTTDGTGSGSSGGDVVLAGGNAFEYAGSQAGPWLTLKVPNDNSSASGWSNRLETYYWDSSTSQYRLGFHLNEKFLLRTRGVTPDDVAVRFMAHPALNPTWPVMETTKNDNSIKLLQSFESKTVSTVPVVLPYIVNEQGEKLFFGTQDPSTGPYAAALLPGDAWIDYNGEA